MMGIREVERRALGRLFVSRPALGTPVIASGGAFVISSSESEDVLTQSGAPEFDPTNGR